MDPLQHPLLNLLPNISELLGIGDIAGSVIGWVAFVVNYIFSLIAGVFIAFETWIIQIVLQMNTTIVNSVVVQSGFEVTLSLANLGFVAAIIVIAIATILRIQTYGIKQILWKLIIAALLVNFSLVIAGAIINFSDQLTLPFLRAFPGAGGGFINFADSIASAYQPQQYLNPQDQNTAQVTDQELAGFASAAGSSLGRMIAPIAAASMGLLGNLMIVIVLGAIGILLLIRYMYLTILLILMPLAWVSWIFPAWQGQWRNWWSKFFRWTLFAPISIFFLWLVLNAGAAIHGKTQDSPFSDVNTTITSGSSGVSGGLFELFGDALAPVLGTFLNGLVLAGLTVGGLIAANSLSILGAGAAMNVAKNAATGLGRVTVRGGRRLGAWGLTKTRADKGLEKISGKLAGGGFFGKMAARPLARTASAIKVAGGEKLVAEAKARNRNLTLTQKIAMTPSAAPDEMIGFIDDAAKGGRLHEIKNLDRLLSKENEGLFNRYGASEVFKTARSKSGLEAMELRKELEKVSDAGDIAGRKKILEQIEFLSATTTDTAGIETFFRDYEGLKKENKVPLGMAEEDFKNQQKFYAKEIATNFSANSIAQFHKNVAKKGDPLLMRKIFNELQDIKELEESNYSPQFKKYRDMVAAGFAVRSEDGEPGRNGRDDAGEGE